MRRREEELNGNLGVRLYQVLARYPVLSPAEQLVYETRDGRVRVEVKHALKSSASFKAFLYCLWRAKEVEEREKDIVLYVDKWEVFGLLGEDVLTLEEITRLLEPVQDVRYVIWTYEDGGKRVETFRLFHKLEGYEGKDRNYLKVVIDKDFYEFCVERGVFLYLGFLHELRSPYAINLWTFLTVHSGVLFSEEVLFEKAGLTHKDMPVYRKREVLTRALGYLIQAGYIKGYEREGDKIRILRKPPEELRLLALEKTQALMQKLKTLRENYLLKERERKKRARVEKSNKKPALG